MALNYNGTTQYLSAGATVTALPFTLACWVFPTIQPLGTIGIALGNNSPSANRVMLGLQDISATQYKAYVQTQANSSTSTATVTGINEWSHIAGVFGTSTAEPFLNGTGGTTHSTSVFPVVSETLVGVRRNNTLAFYFQGRIAEVGIWNAALTAAEIASLAKGMTCDKVRPQSLVFYAPLVRDLTDQKGGRAITNNNGATVANHPRVYA